MQITYSYKPVPTVRKFSESDDFIRGLMGPFGSGKSSGCVTEIIARSLKQKPGPDGIRRSRWGVIRNSYPQLRDTTIKTVHQWLPPVSFGNYKATDHDYFVTAFENCVIEIMFRALDRPDQVSNLLSLELTAAWVNEAREVPWTIIEALQGRVGRFPAVRDGGCSWHGIIMDTNPPEVDSKWHKFFEETEHSKHFASIYRQPSGRGKKAENIANLPKNYYSNLAQGKDKEWVKVYVDGEYGFVIDGRPVYSEYLDEVHCASDIKHISYAPIYRGWDFGLCPACAFCQILPSGKFIVFDEMVSESMGIDTFSQDVIEYCSETYPEMDFIDIGDPAGEQRAQTDEKTCFQIMQAKGINIEAGLQTPTIRFESVKRPLTRLVAGKPMFGIHPRCKVLRKGFQGGYQFRRLQVSAERYTDRPDKNFYSHVMNGLEYVCSRIFGGGLTTGKPRDREESSVLDDTSRSEITGY